ncbi:MAG: hypothetical protein KDA75_14610 [Planctomycetaceae bacterium]|nr:hypothetical protein [Planctomycetaceae bacterium]
MRRLVPRSRQWRRRLVPCSRWWSRRLCFVGGLACLLVAQCLSAFADNPFESLLPPKDALPQPNLLVLQTGQVVEGEIRPQVGGYLVHTPQGSLIVQYEQVRTAASSLDDAYVRIRDNRNDPSATERIELAQWCLQVGLSDAAEQELLAALRLEPDRVDARRLLLQVEGVRRQAARGKSATSDARNDVTMQPTAVAARAPAAAGGLSRQRVAEFTRQIQPLLLNCCGNAACHGGQSPGDFQLRPTARLNRLETDANLSDVLKWIDASNPEASALLTVPRQTDEFHVQAFRGPKSEEQFARLVDWVRLVAHETRSTAAPTASSPSTPAIVPASATIPEAAPGLPVRDDASMVSPIGSLPRRISEVDDAFLRKIVDDEAHDPFDPEEFNRRVHGGKVSNR